jgi:hypothetical protein
MDQHDRYGRCINTRRSLGNDITTWEGGSLVTTPSAARHANPATSAPSADCV